MEEVTLKMMLEKDLEQQKAFQTLLKAISNRDYAAAEEMLKQLGKTSVVRNRSFDLCSCAIRSGCPRDVFVRLLPYCRPLDELEKCAVSRSSGLLPYIGEEGGLVQEAAKWNNAAVLEFLLEQGFSPNARWKGALSPLELALMHRAQDVLRLLVRRDDVDFTVTQRILMIWGAKGMNPETDACLRIAAGRLSGEDAVPEDQEVPLLPGVTTLHAAQNRNWPLVRRFCGEGRVSEQEGARVLEDATSLQREPDIPECAGLLDALFAACPGLLRKKYPRYLLALCMLQGEEKELAQLRPWVERMPGRAVVLCERVLAGELDDMTAYLHLWDERMGPRLRPVLHRSRELPIRLMVDGDRDDAIRALFRYCTVRGKPPEGSVSRLTAHVLHLMSPALLAELLETETLFPQEDASALLRYCETMMDFRRQEKRNILLAYLRKDIRYEI